MENTANLLLPYIMPSQAQKHITHNEALRRLDAMMQLAVLDRDLATPPATPAEGQRYIVAGSATDAWEGREDTVAAWQDGGWAFFDPVPGWVCLVLDESDLVFWTGAQWESISPALAALQNLPLLGVGTAADAENRFAAKLNKALWTALAGEEGGSGDLRYTMNKQGPANMLSLLMQSAWSGRAQIGLVGDDDLSVEVSSDGTTWTRALTIDRQSGRVALPHTNMLTDFSVSLLPDSGRFAGNEARSTTIDTFSFPSYVTLYNGTSAASAGKYIFDNDDYGGDSGMLSAAIRDLINLIRAPAIRRYGNEFFAAEITKGSGTQSSAAVVNGVSYYLSAFLAFGPRVPCMTFHVYMRALDATVVYRHNPGQVIIKNGVRFSTHVPVTPEEGWVSVTVHDTQTPYLSNGYTPTPFTLSMAAAGHRCLIACPALMGGITEVDDAIGIIAGINRWLP